MLESSCRMEGKFSIVTGANSGIGYQTALGLARMGSVVVMVSKDTDRGERARREIAAASGNPLVNLMIADLSSQADVRNLAARYKEKYPRLDVLVNNAGIGIDKRIESADGYELTFATNYLGHFLLTMLLLDVLEASAPSRIVNVSSFVHRMAQGIDFDDLDRKKKFSFTQAYAESKLAMLMFTYELAKKLEGTGVTVNALNPGLVRTNLGKDMSGFMKVNQTVLMTLFAITPEKGAQTSIYLASSPEVEGVTGKYFFKKKAKASTKASYNTSDWQRLWEISEKLTRKTSERAVQKPEIVPVTGVTGTYKEYMRH